MATTQTVKACSLMKGPHYDGDLFAYELVVNVSGTYATNGGTVDFLAALQAQHGPVSAVSVKQVTLWQDYNDGTNRYTSPNADITLSGTGNKTITFELWSGTTDGDEGSGSEVTNTTAVSGNISLLVVASLTPRL